MMSKTPQKKNSLELDKKTDPKSNNSFAWNNGQLQRSIFKSKPDESTLKNSQVLLNKVQAKGALGMGRKYPQPQQQMNNIFKKKQQAKEYRQVVISDQFVRSSKLYKMLKEQVAISDARYMKQTTQLNEIIKKQGIENKQLKVDNHQNKLELWELRNQLVELNSMYQQLEDQNKKLVQEYQYVNGEIEDQQQLNQDNQINNDNADEKLQEQQQQQQDNSNSNNNQHHNQYHNQYHKYKQYHENDKNINNKQQTQYLQIQTKTNKIQQKPQPQPIKYHNNIKLQYHQQQLNRIINMKKQEDEQYLQLQGKQSKSLKSIQDKLQQYLQKINQSESEKNQRELQNRKDKQKKEHDGHDGHGGHDGERE